MSAVQAARVSGVRVSSTRPTVPVFRESARPARGLPVLSTFPAGTPPAGVLPLAHPCVRRCPRHAEGIAAVPCRHRAPAAARPRAGPRRDPGGEHGEARHQVAGEADATRDGRIGDAVGARAHHAEHPGRRRMLSEGIPGHLTARPVWRGIAGPGRKVHEKNPGRPRNRLTVNERKIQRELLNGRF